MCEEEPENRLILSGFRLDRGSLAPILKKPAFHPSPVLTSMMGTTQRHGVTEQGSGVISVVVHSQVFHRAAHDAASVPSSSRRADLSPVARAIALGCAATLAA